MTYELIPNSLHVESEYCDSSYDTTFSVDVRRSDGETGDIWIVAGVPQHLRGTSDAARTQSGYQDVWVYGDSLDTWCPESFRQSIVEDSSEMHRILDAVRNAAIAAHNERR